MNKFELTKNKKEVFGTTLYQIKALKDFSNVSKGDLGGWIKKESNLSQLNNAWVYDDAKVYGNARVYGDAWVSGSAKVYGNAWVYDDAWVYDGARVCGSAYVYGNALVYGDAKVCGNAQVYDDAKVYGNEKVMGSRTEKENNKDSSQKCLDTIYNGCIDKIYLEKSPPLKNATEWGDIMKECAQRCVNHEYIYGKSLPDKYNNFNNGESQKGNKRMSVNKIMNSIKANLSPVDRKLVKAGFLDSKGERTDEYNCELDGMIRNEAREAMDTKVLREKLAKSIKEDK